jgi:hypothetical protein
MGEALEVLLTAYSTFVFIEYIFAKGLSSLVYNPRSSFSESEKS